VSPTRTATALGLWLAATVARAAPLPADHYGLPVDVSRDGHHVDSLLWFTLIAITLIYLVVLAVMFFSFARHGRGHRASFDGGTRRSIGVLMGSVALIFVAVDGNLFARTISDMNEIFWNFADVDKRPDVVRIEVNAHQWAWVARYAGPDGQFNTADDVVTTNDIRVPLGAPVLIQLASTDVIHSLYLPNFRVKRDAVPGQVNGLWFQAERTGQFEIGCAQHCGPNHYKMRGVLTVMTPTDYQQWLRESAATAQRGFDPDDAEAHWGWAWRSL
jgi:cytochrome c oxidase subunit 2